MESEWEENFKKYELDGKQKWSLSEGNDKAKGYANFIQSILTKEIWYFYTIQFWCQKIEKVR